MSPPVGSKADISLQKMGQVSTESEKMEVLAHELESMVDEMRRSVKSGEPKEPWIAKIEDKIKEIDEQNLKIRQELKDLGVQLKNKSEPELPK